MKEESMNDVQARISELEADRDEFLEQRNEYIGFEKEARAERDALAAVIEKVRAHLQRTSYHPFKDALFATLNAVPADLLREHDADVWDAAVVAAHGRLRAFVDENGLIDQHLLIHVPANPYRVKPEDEWVDPEPWFYPVSGMRTAHKLAYTNAEYRPRTVKPEDEQ